MKKDLLNNIGPIGDCRTGRSGNGTELMNKRRPRVPLAVQEQRDFNNRTIRHGLSADPNYIRRVIREDN